MERGDPQGQPHERTDANVRNSSVLQTGCSPQGEWPAEGRRDVSMCSKDTRFSSNLSLHASNNVALTGPKYFAPDFVESRPVASPLPRGEEARNQGQETCSKEDLREIRCGTWNLAGTCAKKVKTLISQMPECDLLVVQEFPKQPPGWKLLRGDVFHAALYQDHIMYRATGLFYDTGKFNLCKKFANPRGAWFLLQHKITQKQFWIGTAHLPNNEPKEELLRLMHGCFGISNRKGYPAVLLGDFNIQFRWRESETGVKPGVIDSKWAELRQKGADAGFRQIPPGTQQLHTPTFHSRKGNVTNTQIDGVFATAGVESCMMIIEGSRAQIGTDHDRVEISFVLRGAAVKRVRAGGPRIVHRTLPEVAAVTQATLQTISQQCTKPANLGPKFAASAATKTLRDMARHSNRPEDWKLYLSTPRKEKQKWKGERIERASSDWKLYMALTKTKPAWGDEFLARAEGEGPVEDVVDHFQKVFHDREVGEVGPKLEQVVAGIAEGKTMEPFSEAEVKRAVMQGHSGRAVGPDLVPIEVLKVMVTCRSSLTALCDFFTGILASEDPSRMGPICSHAYPQAHGPH